MKAEAGLGGDWENPGKGRTGMTLCYHKYNKFQAVSAGQKAELNEWKEANGRSKEDKGVGKKGGGKRSPGSSPCNATNANKKWKSMISEMEACQTKMYEAMAEVQVTSIAAIHATSTVELYNDSVFLVGIWLVFLGNYCADTEENLVGTFGTVNWREPLFPLKSRVR
jgi:hypothetical protein